MTADKPTSTPLASPLSAISLKLVGVVTIVSALLDYIILAVPPDLLNAQWQLNFTTQVVDRGIVPLVGVALLLTGFWVDRNAGRSSQSGTLLLDLRFWACVLSSLLGLIFLVLTFLHVNNVRITSQEALAQVSRQATEAESQLEQRLQGQLSQQRDQLTQLLENETLLQQAIESGQVPEELQQLQGNPEALDQFIGERAKEAQQRLQSEIANRQEEARQQVRQEAIKSAIRISISSLLLAIGYTVIGWTGLRRLMMINRPA